MILGVIQKFSAHLGKNFQLSDYVGIIGMIYFSNNQAISFRYETVVNRKVPRRVVVCELVDVWLSSGSIKTEVVFEGRSICHPNDRFTKETGRKRALADALKNSGFNYDARKLVWEAYHNRAKASQFV